MTRAVRWLLGACVLGAILISLQRQPVVPESSAGRSRISEALGASDQVLTILVFENSTADLTPFLGDRGQNVVSNAPTVERLRLQFRERRWDAVAVLQDLRLREPSLGDDLRQAGYRVLIDDDQYLVALPVERLHMTPLVMQEPLRWTPFAAPEGTSIEALADAPRIRSERSVDAGVMTQVLKFDSDWIVEARVEGQVVTEGAHAAHLSVLGREPALLLAAGDYTADRVYTGLVRALPQGQQAGNLAFGLGGWTTGRGDLRLVSLSASRLTIAPGSIVPQAAHAYPLVRIAILTCGCFVLIAWFGRSLRSSLGIRRLSLFGSDFVVGYAALTAAMLVCLRLGAGVGFAAGLCVALFLWAFGSGVRRRVRDGDRSSIGPAVRRELSALINPIGRGSGRGSVAWVESFAIASWVAAIAITLLPIQVDAAYPWYRLPDLYDLPKHLFAMRSGYGALAWPLSNPFFHGEDFAYNFGFYLPLSSIARVSGEPLATLQTFALGVVMLAFSVPLVLRDLIRTISASRGVQLAGVLLVTWVGGWTPLWLGNADHLGASLHSSSNLIQSLVWGEEVFVYVIFVPQHVFAALCVVLSVFFLSGRIGKAGDSPPRRLIAAGITMVAGSLSSLLVLPYLVVSFTLIGGVMIFKARTPLDSRGTMAGRAVALLAPLVVLAPFVLDAKRWSEGAVGMPAAPDLTLQWFYIFASIGVCVPVAVLAWLPSGNRTSGGAKHAPLTMGLSLVAAMAFIVMLFGGQMPDVAMKAVLVFRICLVPLACIGLLRLQAWRHKRNGSSHFTAIASAVFGAMIVINLPTVLFFTRSGWSVDEPANRSFVQYVRHLPADARIVLFAPEQFQVALIGRPIDFDFSAYRPDSYLPPLARVRADAFWKGFSQGSPESIDAIVRRYDYAIAPRGSNAAARLDPFFNDRRLVGGYAIYRIAGQGSR